MGCLGKIGLIEIHVLFIFSAATPPDAELSIPYITSTCYGSRASRTIVIWRISCGLAACPRNNSGRGCNLGHPAVCHCAHFSNRYAVTRNQRVHFSPSLQSLLRPM